MHSTAKDYYCTKAVELALPKRIRSHILENKSVLFLQESLPENWIYVRSEPDYGLDFNIEIVDNFNVTGMNFSGQLKAKEADTSKETINLNGIKKTTINRWINRLEPIMLIAYIENTTEAYWSWFNENEVNLRTEHNTVTLKIPKTNRLSKINWNEVSSYVGKIFRRKNGLDSIPDIEFSNIDSDQEALAWRLFFDGEHEKAELLFKELLKTDTKFGWWVGRAQCEYHLYRYPEALVSINTALKFDVTEDLLNVKASILAEYGIKTRDQAKLLAAEKIFKDLSTKSNDFITHYNYANTLQSLHKYDAAIQEYKVALNLNPNYAAAWKNLGGVYNYIKQFDKEIECYEEALKINPELPEALMSKGITLFRDYDDPKNGLFFMLESLKSVTNLSTVFPLGYYWIGSAYLQLENLDEAIKWINEGLDNNPGQINLLFLKSNYYYHNYKATRELRQQAIEYFTYFDELYPNDPENITRTLEFNILDGISNNELLSIIKEKKLLIDIEMKDLNILGLNIKDEIRFVRNTHAYTIYKEKFPNSRHGFHLTDIGFQTSAKLYAVLDFIFLLTLCRLNKAAEIDSKTEKGYIAGLSKSITESFIQFLPKLIIYILSENEKDKNLEVVVQTISKLSLAIVNIALSEATTLLSYTVGAFELDKTLLEEILFEPEGLNQKLSKDMLLATIKELYIYFDLPLK